jgi:tetratricopeptide (TPR) repeat protein
MKFFAMFAMILFAAGLLPASAQKIADDQFITFLGLIQQADALVSSGQPQPALNQYVALQGELQKFQKNFPDWQPAIVKFRLKYLADKITDLTAQIPAAPPAATVTAANANPAPEISPADAELASLRGQLQALQSDNTLLTAKLKEALAAQPAMLDAGELAKAQAQIQSLMKENDLFKVTAAQTAADTNALARAQLQIQWLMQENESLKTNPAPVRVETTATVDTNALVKMAMQIQSLTQENELLKTNLAQEKTDTANALAAAAATLALARQSLTEATNQLDGQTARADKLAAANGDLQARLQSLLASPAALAALQNENTQLKKQLADLQSSTPASAPAADKLAADLQAAKLQVAALQLDTVIKQLELTALENRFEKLKTATNTLAVAPANAQAANLARIRSLTQERDALLGQLGEANQQLHGAKKPDATAQINDLTDQIRTLRARLAVDEAPAVPYTAEELALFKQAAPLLANPVAEKKSIAELPAGSAALVAAAQRYFSAKQFDQAEANYLQILQKDEKNPLVLANLAAIELEQGKVDDADRHITAAVAQNPNDAYNLATLGYLKFRQEKYDEALDALSRAAKLDPQNPEIENYLGVTLSHKGLRTQAETALRKAIQLDPNYAAAHNNLAAIYISQTPPLVELARWHYQKALAAGQPHNPDLEKALGLDVGVAPVNPQ